MEEETLSIEEAAAHLGVHYMTIYRYVRTGRLPAERRGGRWRIRTEDLEHATSEVVGETRPAAGRRAGTGVSRSLDQATRRLKDRMIAGDVAGAWNIIESALMAGAPTDVYLKLLAPCLRTIGDEWESGRITIADEHRATAVALGTVGRLSPLFQRRGRRRPGLVLLAGAEGDPHSIPLAMVADHLRAEGFDLIHLGADVPVDTLLALAGAKELSGIGLSASTRAGAVNAARAVAELHDRVPDVPVMLGGPAVPNERAARRVGADGWAPDAAGVAELFVEHRPVERRP